jgi:small subunit ribosomal protein S20
MATHASARKRHRQSLKRRERNNHVRRTCRSAVRRARQAILTGAPDAEDLRKRAERVLRKAASKGIYHPRTVSRTVSRLVQALRAPARA